MSRPNGEPLEHRALHVFAQFLARGSRVDGHAIDDLCRSHPDLEPSLRGLAEKRSEVKLQPPRVGAGPIVTVRRRLAKRSDLPAPSWDRYVLLGELARGGMGLVLHVWDTVLERPLAMKVLDTKDLPKGPAADETVARFLAEAQVAGRLEHPGIVPIHDLGLERGGRVYFTMPVLEGRNLDEVFQLARSRSEGWSIDRALLVIAKVCEVMGYAHSRGVIHRDLKPANVMVKDSGEICIVDWGLAKLVDCPEAEPAVVQESKPADASRPDPALNGTVSGTPPYMAPEQASGRQDEISDRSDVYALGAILYRLLAGRGPYAPRKGQEEPEATVELIRRGSPTPLRRLAPGAAAELVAISEKAMARRPEDRYAEVEEMARDLHAFLAGSSAETADTKGNRA